MTKLTDANIEIVNEAHQALLRMGDFISCENPRAWIKASNKFTDACIDAGMVYDHADPALWASLMVAEWLRSGPAQWAGSFYPRNYKLMEGKP